MSKPKPVHRVAVLGAGIAGSAVARALCVQGIQVHLFDQATGPAQGASGNWVGAFHPHITRGDSPLSQLSRLGFRHTLTALTELTELGLLDRNADWGTPGHLQTLADADAARAQDTLNLLALDSGLVRWAEPHQHLPTPLPGYYFPNGGWVKPARWVEANLVACGALLTEHYGQKVEHAADLLENHDAVVVACAENSLAVAPIEGAMAGAVKGQITRMHLHPTAPKRLPLVLSGETYAISPPQENWALLGATYERPVIDLTPTDAADQQNLDRFKQALPDWPLGEILDRRCAVRFVWNDRLPAIGPVPNMPGVYMSTGFASRGLLWAALGGWIIARHCTGQAIDLPLLDKIKPRAARSKAVTRG